MQESIPTLDRVQSAVGKETSGRVGAGAPRSDQALYPVLFPWTDCDGATDLT